MMKRLALLIPFFFTACGMLESGKREVTDKIDRLQFRIDQDRWKNVAELMADDFTYENEKGQSASGKAGKIAFHRSIKQIRNMTQFSFEVDTIAKRGKSYYATVVVYADVQRNQSSTKSVSWMMRQTWKKVGEKWLLAKVKDLSPRKSSGSSSAPVRSASKSDADSAADYATGTTPLRTKSKINKQLDEINKQNQNRQEQ